MDTREYLHPTRVWRIWGIAFDARIVQLVVISTLLLLVNFYHKFLQVEYNQLVLHFVVPLAIVVFLWREPPRLYGLRVGDWKLGLPIAAASMLIMAVVIWVVGRTPAFVAFYQKLANGRSALQIVVDTGFELLAWEFFCRGWLMFGLARKYGTDAVWLQAVPFALMHLLKPELEGITTIFGGALFGMLAWRTRSFAYGWLIHWFMVAFMILVAAGYLG